MNCATVHKKFFLDSYRIKLTNFRGVFRKQIRIRSNADNPREILIVKGLIE